MGIIARVYRSGKSDEHGLMTPDDSTMNGWSRLYDSVCVINADGPFEPDANRPAVKIVRHATMHSLHAISVEDEISGKWTMFGGNFLHGSDSRFGELCRRLLMYDRRGKHYPQYENFYGIGAVSIHDRIEG